MCFKWWDEEFEQTGWSAISRKVMLSRGRNKTSVCFLGETSNKVREPVVMGSALPKILPLDFARVPQVTVLVSFWKSNELGRPEFGLCPPCYASNCCHGVNSSFGDQEIVSGLPEIPIHWFLFCGGSENEVVVELQPISLIALGLHYQRAGRDLVLFSKTRLAAACFSAIMIHRLSILHPPSLTVGSPVDYRPSSINFRLGVIKHH